MYIGIAEQFETRKRKILEKERKKEIEKESNFGT